VGLACRSLCGRRASLVLQSRGGASPTVTNAVADARLHRAHTDGRRRAIVSYVLRPPHRPPAVSFASATQCGAVWGRACVSSQFRRATSAQLVTVLPFCASFSSAALDGTHSFVACVCLLEKPHTHAGPERRHGEQKQTTHNRPDARRPRARPARNLVRGGAGPARRARRERSWPPFACQRRIRSSGQARERERERRRRLATEKAGQAGGRVVAQSSCGAARRARRQATLQMAATAAARHDDDADLVGWFFVSLISRAARLHASVCVCLAKALHTPHTPVLQSN
jgi:hypothetical protein